ncbi:hypothetical protein [Albimonas pacifica]|uniref:Uncharacterized protein n=1 Tax=Albimonas pacifica TaxID=1114924 RepID=A0A1I3FVE1_9RHOB|nr:hypothetical protein [Albimonas pacifica]SFI15220.1 hypothetical protein SAMN05216258_104545 [Albimonas pacifica]
MADDNLADMLAEALAAIGALPEGFCVCPNSRDARRPERFHVGECREARAALAAHAAARADVIPVLTAEAMPEEDGWIPWEGGECPVPPETLVQIRCRSAGPPSEGEDIAEAANWFWGRGRKPAFYDLIAYRLHKEPR